jgi:EpsI family protein
MHSPSDGLSWRAFVPAFVLLLGCGFVWQTHAQRQMQLAAPLTSIIPALDGYAVVDLHIGDEERRVAGMSDYVARSYVRDSVQAFQTLVSYYDRQGQGKTIHSPRNCLPGAGWEVLRGGSRSIVVDGASHDVNYYVLKNGPATDVVYYWYQGRGRVVASEYRVKWNLLRDAALLGHTEEALVRIVIPVRAQGGASGGSPDAQHAFAAADSLGDGVAKQLIREVTRALPGKAS